MTKKIIYFLYFAIVISFAFPHNSFAYDSQLERTDENIGEEFADKFVEETIAVINSFLPSNVEFTYKSLESNVSDSAITIIGGKIKVEKKDFTAFINSSEIEIRGVDYPSLMSGKLKAKLVYFNNSFISLQFEAKENGDAHIGYGSTEIARFNKVDASPTNIKAEDALIWKLAYNEHSKEADEDEEAITKIKSWYTHKIGLRKLNISNSALNKKQNFEKFLKQITFDSGRVGGNEVNNGEEIIPNLNKSVNIKR